MFGDNKIVAVGGGTGLSVMLKGLKKYTNNLTAIVTVADDGGGSGKLRYDLNILPPGDIRNCIRALADSEPLMNELISYRFTDGDLKGQSFGNLLLAAMTGVCGGDFIRAVREVSNVLRVCGEVLPVTGDDVLLTAVLENGVKVYGESAIGHSTQFYNSKIKSVGLEKKALNDKTEIKPLKEAIQAIEDADIIVLGPGSLYTSVMPNLIVPGIKEAVKSSKASVVYVNNIMTQHGETDGYTAFEHYNAVIGHTFDNFIDYCIVNSGTADDEILEKYRAESAFLVENDAFRFKDSKAKVIEEDMIYLTREKKIRHDTLKLADIIYKILKQEKKI